MKKILFCIVVFLAVSTLSVEMSGQEKCDIDISVADITKGDIVPSVINSKVEGKLSQALSKAGMTSAPYDSRFFIAARFDDAFNDVTGGPSPKNIVKTTLTIYIGDADEQKIFSSESFELKGVGSTEQLAYTRALNSIGGGNEKLVKFIESGKQKIIDYFNNNYQSYINKAHQLMASRNYDEALYYATVIPSCCKGYAEAQNLAMRIYNQSMNFTASSLLAKARAAWAADPSAEGAAKAHEFLSQIDPEANCASEAKAFGEEVAKTTQKQWEFENVTKYKDAMSLQQRRIDAAKEIGVAWAKSRPQLVNRYVFITPRRY